MSYACMGLQSEFCIVLFSVYSITSRVIIIIIRSLLINLLFFVATFLSWYRNLMAIMINLLNAEVHTTPINQTEWYFPDLFCGTCTGA